VTTFVDTSAFYALLDRDDRNHPGAAAAWSDLVGAEPLLTSSYVVVEATALLQHRLGMPAVRALHDALLGVVEVAFVSAELHARAVAALLVSDRRRLSLVDCASFEVMRSHGVPSAFAFDADFAEQGFALVPGKSIA